MIETSLLGWIIGAVFFSAISIAIIRLYELLPQAANEEGCEEDEVCDITLAKAPTPLNDKAIPQILYTLLGLGGPLVSLLIAAYLIFEVFVFDQSFSYHGWTWLQIAHFSLEASLQLDHLGTAMLIFVSFVGFIIHLYAHAYMKEEPGYARFFAWFNLFMASMFLLILADNPFMMFIGWEGVGLCSYLLIAFYYDDEGNVKAGNKAFVLNRIGDFGFISGLSLLFVTIGQNGLDFTTLEAHIHLIPTSMLQLIGVLLFIGAMGKSAQIPLYIWLPDAMAGPTPVSALIHAATMVTAGVYMVARFHFLYAGIEEVGLFIAYIGAFSALLSALIAIRQDDIKKILAYSTMSQLGYMFMAVGLGAYSYGIFHVFTHAFFKAVLFMGAGAIILALHHEQNIKNMGALRHKMPLVFTVMLIATLAISGIPPFSGFISKDAILNHTFASGHYLIFALALVTAALTAYYMFRLFILVFIAPQKQNHSLHAPSKLMHFTLIILGTGAVFLGLFNLPPFFGGNEAYSLWLNLPDMHHVLSHDTEIILLGLNLSAAIAGIALAFKHYRHTSEEPSLGLFAPLIHNKFYVDEIATAIVLKPIRALSKVLNGLDQKIIDRFVHAFAEGYQRLAYWSDYVQNGSVRYYAIYMTTGIVSLFIYLLAGVN